MSYKQNNFFSQVVKSILCTGIFLFTITGCESDDDSDDTLGSVRLYNASANAPEIFLTVDENIDEYDDDEADDFEKTFSSIELGESTGNFELEAKEYYVELAWQDDDSSYRDDLEVIYQTEHKITKDNIHLIVIAEDIQSPTVLSYDIAEIDDDDDADDELFNLSLLNMHPWSDGIDIYLSKSDESFNQAKLLGEYNYTELSDNQKLEIDEYVFYITSAGSEEVLYQSSEIDYQYTNQYVMVIRENPGVGDSPFVIDRVSSSNVELYQHEGDSAQFRTFNAIVNHDLLPNYQGEFALSLNSVDDSIEISATEFGEFSNSVGTAEGDYSADLSIPDTGEIILQNHLITLAENTDKTIFFYLEEDDVDLDGDGDVDEDGDGYVDEVEITVKSLVVDNSTSASIYNHEIKIINFVDNDDFNAVGFYFVRSDELIETASLYQNVSYSSPAAITLVNNTYSIYAVAQDGSSDVILVSTQLTLDENSEAMFLILEENIDAPSGYNVKFANQKGY
ncbi:hypothetical protein RI844_17025 [Thalassotalea fonticola]|uniref:DUF4397 domain-containing protein n=1 Tax=Thalassotalea fonticola TaxID=3065649 RepID=A0ABZ0GMV6_9GAMM|nr:hypothetical protein RI844_17025 [Colwelliaceae bacterium S1-1]